MGRRALRTNFQPDEFASHWIDGQRLTAPLEGRAIFGRTAPLEVEVGTGKGLFLQTAAANHPERDYLGIEIAKKYTFSTAARLTEAGLGNARVIHGDAQEILPLIPDNTVSAVHIYFPDPWWKRRHRKRRVVNQPFTMDVYRVLQPSGPLHFWTDVREYFEVSVEMLQQNTPFLGPFEVPEKPAEHDLDYRTHFERRMRRHEEAVYRSRFEKQGNPVATTNQQTMQDLKI